MFGIMTKKDKRIKALEEHIQCLYSLPAPRKMDASLISVKSISFCSEKPLYTNKQMLSQMDTEQLYDKMVWLFHDYGKRFTDSRTAIIEWLNSEAAE